MKIFTLNFRKFISILVKLSYCPNYFPTQKGGKPIEFLPFSSTKRDFEDNYIVKLQNSDDYNLEFFREKKENDVHGLDIHIELAYVAERS